MTNRVFLKTSCLIALALTINFGLGVSFAKSPTRWPQVIESGNPATSGIAYYQLSTGQKLYVKPIHTQPIITVNTWFNVGSVQENAENNGLSHFLEHLIFKGTKTYAKGAIDRIFSEKGADFNATTSKDYTQFYVTVAKPYFKEILDVHADMLVNAAIPEDELKPERLVVQEEINRAMDTPDRKVFNTLTTALFQTHPYVQDTLGPKERIASIPREKILEYFHNWYQPKNMTTVVVGDIEPEEAKAMVEKAFQAALAKEPHRVAALTPKRFAIPAMPDGPNVSVFSDPNVTEPSLMLVFPAPSAEKTSENIALDVAAEVLGQGRSSRLGQQLKEEAEVARDVGAGNYTFEQGGMLYFTVETTMGKLAQARQLLMDELLKFRNTGMTPQEFAKVKKQNQKSFVFLTESTQGYAESLGGAAAFNRVHNFTHYLDYIQALTPEQVKAAFRKNVTLKKAILVELLPGSVAAKDVLKEKETAQKTLNSICSTDKTFCETSLVHEKELVLTLKPKKPVLKSVITPLPVKLANGIKSIQLTRFGTGETLIMRPVSDAQTVAVTLMFRGGRLVSPKTGLAELGARLFLKGTPTMSAGRLAAYLEANGIRITAGLQNDYFTLQGQAMTEDLDKLLTVLGDLTSAPQAPQDELTKEREYMLQEIRTNRDAPKARMFELLTDNLFPNHPYGISGEELEKALPAYNRNDVMAYYHDILLQPTSLTASVVGNFDPLLVKGKLTQNFEAMRHYVASNVATSVPLIRSEPNITALPQSEEVRAQKPKQAATWIGYAWQAPKVAELNDYIPTKVINGILGVGFTSRLFDHLRKANGWAYETASFYQSFRRGGNMTLYIGTDPKNEADVLKGIDKEITDLKTNKVSADELERNKSQLIGDFLLAHEGMAAQAQYLALYETMGLGFNFDSTYSSLIEKVTSEDVLRAAQKLFGQPTLKVIVSPASVRQENE